MVVEGLVRAGALQENSEKAGLAAFTGRYVDAGAPVVFDFAQIYEELESCGASFGLWKWDDI